jgi:exopolyphosphatase/pppGpp-phosphohydrolase
VTNAPAGLAGTQQPEWVASMPLGCLSVQRAAGDPSGWTSAAEAALRLHGGAAAARLRAAAAPGPAGGPGTGAGRLLLVATGGTVTSAEALALRLPRYEHARVHMARLGVAQLLAIAEELADKEAQARCDGSWGGGVLHKPTFSGGGRA